MGHALNKVLKDIINKYKTLKGFKVHFVPGWDCHGLPIELKVLQNLKSDERRKLNSLALRKKLQSMHIFKLIISWKVLKDGVFGEIGIILI